MRGASPSQAYVARPLPTRASSADGITGSRPSVGARSAPVCTDGTPSLAISVRFGVICGAIQQLVASPAVPEAKGRERTTMAPHATYEPENPITNPSCRHLQGFVVAATKQGFGFSCHRAGSAAAGARGRTRVIVVGSSILVPGFMLISSPLSVMGSVITAHGDGCGEGLGRAPYGHDGTLHPRFSF
jgi:hypothetical protein